MILYRPVGLIELRTISSAEWKKFPPLPPEQPYFCPLLDMDYAVEIARDWKTKEEPYAGFVTRFEIPDDYAAQFEIHKVGNSDHQELWVPAEQLDTMNSRIVGRIEVGRCYYGKDFEETLNTATGLPAAVRKTS